MTRPEKSIDTQREKNCGNAPFQNIQWKILLDETQEENCHGNGSRVSERDWKQRANNCGAALFLQAKRQRKQPAHSGVQTVVGPENRQGYPRPVVIHG
jgi:hypothetical protein